MNKAQLLTNQNQGLEQTVLYAQLNSNHLHYFNKSQKGLQTELRAVE